MSRITELEFIKIVVDGLEQRSTCVKGQIGALAVREGNIIMTGYNGAPPGESHCIDKGCILDAENRCIRATHAEANLISRSTRFGVLLKDTDIYCSRTPCNPCARLLVNADIKSFTYLKDHRRHEGLDLLIKNKILVDER